MSHPQPKPADGGGIRILVPKRVHLLAGTALVV
jgi:hypothetical protein